MHICGIARIRCLINSLPKIVEDSDNKHVLVFVADIKMKLLSESHLVFPKPV